MFRYVFYRIYFERIYEVLTFQDSEIQKLQKQLKEAEQILATAIFQARQKLSSISKANKRPVNSEELIKYAHRISAADAVCAPLNWMPGDIRRPYPTDIEMRMGLIGKSDINLNGAGGLLNAGLGAASGGSGVLAGHQQHGNNLGEIHRSASSGGSEFSNDIPNSAHNQFNWNQMGDLHMSMGSSSVSLDTRHKDTSQDDVEVMSTDSSSSSSSDSQ